MLPRVVPEPQYPGYDQNGQPRSRYTATWSTRPLGAAPQALYFNNQAAVEKHWEPKNTYENMCWALFLALFQLCCALAYSCLFVYHWATAKGQTAPPWQQSDAASLLMAGLSASVVSAFAMIAFYPDKKGRVTKRLVIILSIPALVQILEAIAKISSQIYFQSYQKQPINGFYIAEIILISLILLFSAVILYPASEGMVPFGYQVNTPLRAIGMSVNTVVGAIVLIYFCFAIYGVHAAFDTISIPGVPYKLLVSTFALPTTSILLISMVGSFVSYARGVRPHMIPSIIISIVAITGFLEMMEQYVTWLTQSMTNDWHDNAYVGMFVLNCLALVGLVVKVGLSVAFTYY